MFKSRCVLYIDYAAIETYRIVFFCSLNAIGMKVFRNMIYAPSPKTHHRLLKNVWACALVLALICALPLASQAQDPERSATIGGRFMLKDHNGQIVTDQDYQGRFMLITFGYIYCPDICPTNLVNMGAALDILGTRADQIVPIFVTVDPARDNVPAMRDYIINFDDRLVGLTGPAPMIENISRRYKIVAEIHRPEGWDEDEYTVDHTASMFLMSPDGDFLVKFAHGMPVEDMAKRMGDFLK